MLDKLFKFGFNLSGIQWVSSYLTNRTQGIYINGIISEPLPVQHGAPQGSVLKQLLFILYINDIPLAVSSCSVELYADTLISFSKSSHGLSLAYLLTEFKHALQFHTYNTRHRDLLRLSLAKTTKCQGSFRYNGARTFNALPLSIRNIIEFQTFKIRAKRYFK